MISTRVHPLPASALCLLLGAGGCATMVHGTTQDIPIATPGPAAVAIDGVPVGTAPTMVTVSRGRSHLITITPDSAAAVEVELPNRLSGWVLGNIFLYYLPAIVDFADGAAYSFKSGPINVTVPGHEASAAMIRAHLAVNQRIRFSAGGANDLIDARLDSATNERLYMHMGSPAQPTTFTIPASFALQNIQRLDVGVADDRWAPFEAHRTGSPLLVDDQLRVSLADPESSVEGRLLTMDSVHLLLATRSGAARIDRAAVTSMQRKQGHDDAEGAKRALMVGAIVGGLIAAKRKGDILNPDGPAFMRGNVIGAVLGLSLTRLLAPGRWVGLSEY
jgi:hypothetical protein